MAGRCPVAHSSDWPVVRLGTIALKIGSGATPRGGEEAYLPSRSKFALVRSQNVFDRRFDSTGLAFISDEQAEGLKNVILQPGDLLLNITGDGITFSRACAVPIDVLPACVNQHVAIVRVDRTVADPVYVLTYLTHPSVKSYIESFNAGGSRRAITKEHIESFELPLPPISEQRAIAHILGTLDDKIELNRRMNETLQAMARALFKSWFVDFLPVRAKMAAKANDPSQLLPQAQPNTWYVYAIECNDECNDGSLYIGQTEDLRQRWLQHVGGKGARWTRQNPPVCVPYWEKQPSREAAVERENWLKTGYGRKWLKQQIAARTQTGDPVRAKAEGRSPALPKPLADLFPDAFEDSPLGEIPEGWEVETLGDHYEAVKGVSYKGSGLRDEGMPLHNLNSVYEGGGYKYEGIKHYTGEYAERHVVRSGDVIVANTEQGHDRLLIGYAAIVPALFGSHGIASHHIYRLRPKPGSPLTSAYLCWLLNSAEMHDVVSGYANGTTVNMLPIDGVQKPIIVRPPAALVAAFDSVAMTAEHRREEMISESRTLAALRDALLPKLLSGEVRVGGI